MKNGIDNRNIMDSIHNAKYIYVWERTLWDENVIFIWKGQKTINVYDALFNEIDCFSSMKEIKDVKQVGDLIIDYITNNYKGVYKND